MPKYLIVFHFTNLPLNIKNRNITQEPNFFAIRLTKHSSSVVFPRSKCEILRKFYLCLLRFRILLVHYIQRGKNLHKGMSWI